MSKPSVTCPADGSRIVSDGSDTILFGQPPDILKALLLEKSPGFNTLVLTDIREKGGCLTNNLEFPIYYFLFVINGLAEGRKLNLVGDETHISQAVRLLRLTLNGPVESELKACGTEPALMKEWLEVADELALKRADGKVIQVEEFFNILPFQDDVVELDSLS
ncbi:MAG: hypothetical protein KJP04_09075, partial [Arenicella sp.]|nr:hypothetical protein [Arenicella sp.]